MTDPNNPPLDVPNHNPVAAPILTVTWDTVIGSRNVGWDPATGPESEPVALGDLVVNGLVDRLTAEIKSDAEPYRGAVSVAREAIAAAAKDEATALVREALSGRIQRTDNWGDPQGEPTTLRDLIRGEIQAFLGEKPPRPGYNDTPGPFRQLLKVEVQDALAKELREEIRAARAQVAAAVRERAAEILGDVVKRETR